VHHIERVCRDAFECITVEVGDAIAQQGARRLGHIALLVAVRNRATFAAPTRCIPSCRCALTLGKIGPAADAIDPCVRFDTH
jgi:hypothetical protein